MTAAEQVLHAAPPRLTEREAVDAAVDLFGTPADRAVDLGSERDRTFGLEDATGRRFAVLKVSNELEDPAVLDMEAGAALQVAVLDPDLGPALPWTPLAAGASRPAQAGDDLTALRAELVHGAARHWARLYAALPGNTRIDATSLSDAALIGWGATAARLATALQSYQHPRAKRTMLWDVQHAEAVRPMVSQIRDPGQRRLVTDTLDQFHQHVVPVWPRLRAQVLHADLSVDNTVTDEAGVITGIIDFGDMSHTALVADLASVLDSLAAGRDGEEVFRLARLVLDGYQRHIELPEPDLQALPYAWAARSAITIAISSWRAGEGLEDREFAERYNERCARVLETMRRIGWATLPELVGVRVHARTAGELAVRREQLFGPAMEPLFYDVPVDVASADGVWITDVDGSRLLDAYNNVPTVGHAHPRVVTAISRQSREINTHMRYLHPAAIELAERLTRLAGDGLDTVVLVNSGSEANDLAWRLARAVTGNEGALCTACAYHGITEATAALSPESHLGGPAPGHVETWRISDRYRGRNMDGREMTAALARLEEGSLRPAAAILDGLVMSDGVHDLDGAYVRDLVDQVHAAGGLWIADEVQASHGRNGESFFSYQHHGIAPDLVTLGKPMGNGHPVAAVITRREVLAAIASQTVIFSTFGGNPVSARAALAVLDVFEDERVLARVHETGRVLDGALRDVASRWKAIGDVRGIGLACGVEFVASPESRLPDRDRARAVRDRMRREGVLVGATGPDLNVLKLRPPLAFTTEHVPRLVRALEVSLQATA